MDTKQKTAMRSLPDTLKAVAWSFIGLRRKKDFDQDVGNMNPLYVLVCALIGAGLFIGTLLTVVLTVTS
jgi:hypothetical protein